MKIGIVGAGAIGCFVGAKLALQGTQVAFVGRARGQAEAGERGMSVEDFDGPRATLGPDKVDYAIAVDAVAGCDVVLCAVKSGQTRDTGASLAKVLPQDALVISLQNGLHNAEALREVMPRQNILGGIVGFNVIVLDDGTFRRATSGPLAIEWSADPRLTALAAALVTAGFATELPKNFRAKQWSKLVLNLNNALSALSGVPTKELIFGAGYRRIMRAVLVESLAVMRAGNIEPARMGLLPVRAFPFVLGLPPSLLTLVARAQLKVDPEARSSMWRDLSLGRPTEVEELNGEIVRLAKSVGARAPLNERLVALIHAAEKDGRGSPNFSADTLWEKLDAAN